MKQLQTVFDRNAVSIFYVLGNLNEPTVTGIKTYVESLTNNEIAFIKNYYKEDYQLMEYKVL